MSDVDIKTQEFYNERRVATKLDNPQEVVEANYVGWSSQENQRKGFEIATDLPWINWEKIESVLDIGCGYGKLLELLIFEKHYKGKYYGIDIVPEFIEKAVQRYNDQFNAQFYVGDFLSQTLERERFDVVISLGALSVNHDYPNQAGDKSTAYAQKLISKIVALSRLGISLYFPNIDNIAPSERKPRMAYYSCSEIESMVLGVCNTRCEDITFISFPNSNDLKTIAQIKLIN